MSLIELRNVSKIYKTKAASVRALDNATLRVEEGEFMSVMGPSGSGKTTLLNLIGGLDKPTSGKVKIANLITGKMSPSQLDAMRLEKIGFVFQTFNLIPTLTALENVELVLSIAGLSGSKQEERATELLELVGLGHRLDHRPNELSVGERQRVAIARALANDPDIVLADEPTGNMDTETGNQIVDLMHQLNKRFNKTFIIVTHDPQIAHRTSRIVELRDGRITL
ncbi:MAG: ABC transporter ATP-binding protein [Desulfobacterales bacterium]|nr:ABC transporter ATP-binding protein [Desulfobacterales bacterium]